MDSSLILHIGANKTGSSAIQRFMQKNSAVFRSHGFLIPDQELGWSNKVTGEHVFVLQRYISEGGQGILRAFETLMASRPETGTVLVSAENLSNPNKHVGFEEVCRSYNTKVILYIRRQDDFITSSWQQWYSKTEADINAWIITALRTLGHWESVINHWEGVAGVGNVKVRLFQRDQFHNGNIIWDFLDVLGLGDKQSAFDGSLPEVNPSFANYIVPLVAGSKSIFKNIHDNEFYNVVQSLTGDSYTKGKQISLISRRQRDNIMAFYAGENRRICERFFPGRSGLFDPVDHAKYKYLDEKQVADLQLKFITHLLFELGRREQSTKAFNKKV